MNLTDPRSTPPAPGTGGPNPDDMASFLVELGCALHVYGTPTHRTEEALTRVAARHGLRSQFLVTPTSLQASLGTGRDQVHFLRRLDPGEVDLGKLTRLHQLLQSAYEGEIDPVAGEREIEALLIEPPTYSAPVLALAFALSSGSVASVFGGGWPEILVSTGAGLLAGAVLIWGPRIQRLARLVVPLASFLAAITIGVCAARFELVRSICVVASLIVLVPGLSLTSAINELALGHLVSGTARMTGAILTLMQMGLGVAIGTGLVEALIAPLPAPDPHPLPGWTVFVAIVCIALSCTILFRARLRDIVTVLPMSCVAYFGARYGQAWLGPEAGAATGALLLGMAANAVSRWRDQPTAIAIIPALLLLVPGSMGFRSLQSLMADDVTNGIAAGFETLMIALALVSGLLVANLLVVSRRLL